MAPEVTRLRSGFKENGRYAVSLYKKLFGAAHCPQAPVAVIRYCPDSPKNCGGAIRISGVAI
jgi:hypothetical protein